MHNRTYLNAVPQTGQYLTSRLTVSAVTPSRFSKEKPVGQPDNFSHCARSPRGLAERRYARHPERSEGSLFALPAGCPRSRHWSCGCSALSAKVCAWAPCPPHFLRALCG